MTKVGKPLLEQLVQATGGKELENKAEQGWLGT